MDEEDKPIPQSQPLPGQVPNSAGGFSFQVDDIQRLRRFMVLGSEGGTYYIGEKQLGRENAAAVLRLIEAGRGREVVGEVVTYSLEGRTAKQNPIIFVLALCARAGDVETKRAAYDALSKVCRIPTHLFAFVSFCEALSGETTGWGRAHRNAVQKWYLGKSATSLAMAVTKYQKREGWSHRDLLRLSHVKADSPSIACVLKYIIKGFETCHKDYSSSDDENIKSVLTFLNAVETAKECDERTLVQLIQENGLVREHIPTLHLNSQEIWAALLEKMPMTAMIRNLGKMSSIELLKPLSRYSKIVCDRLKDEAALKQARIHPFNVLLALKTYGQGRGDKGKLKWTPDQSIVTALDEAFYSCFKFVEPTGKRFLLALDVSGSMCCPVMGSNVITCRDASGAMAMVTACVESQYHIVGFSHELVNIPINSSMSLNNVTTAISRIRMGGTDCALPMIYAKKKKLDVDVFIVYTDNETWFGKIHPSEALKEYRKARKINAKLIVCGMASNSFTIADPNDGGMLDIVGFDSAAPEVISNFANGLF